MARCALLLLATVLVLQGLLSAHAEITSWLPSGDGARHLLQTVKPNKAKDPKVKDGVDHHFKRLEKFAIKYDGRRLLLGTDSMSMPATAVAAAAAAAPDTQVPLRHLTQNKPDKPKDAKWTEPSQKFALIEKFYAKKNKGNRRLLEIVKPNKPNNPAWTEPSYKFSLLEKFSYKNQKP